jgi:hypothetical protein
MEGECGGKMILVNAENLTELRDTRFSATNNCTFLTLAISGNFVRVSARHVPLPIDSEGFRTKESFGSKNATHAFFNARPGRFHLSSCPEHVSDAAVSLGATEGFHFPLLHREQKGRAFALPFVSAWGGLGWDYVNRPRNRPGSFANPGNTFPRFLSPRCPEITSPSTLR